MTCGRYTLVRKIGSGGMAEIWKAKAEGPGGFEKTLALKRVLPSLAEDGLFINMFIEEAKLVAHLVHPNIVQVFDFGRTESGEYFIAMEYVGGTNLAQLLRRLADRGVRLPLEIALYVALETCRGLGYAHEKTDESGKALDLVHRDVSPQNVLVSFRGEVKVVDFGIAKVAGAISRTQEGHVRGKLAYMSPEQAHAQPLDPRTDLFALGVVLFEMVTGKRMFGGGTESEIYSRVAGYKEPGEEVAKLPAEVQSILATALQRDPAARFQTAQEMESALMVALGSEGLLQARQALSSIVQRLFMDEQQLDLTPLPSGVEPGLSVTRPSAASAGAGISGLVTTVTPSKSSKVAPPMSASSGLTLAGTKVEVMAPATPKRSPWPWLVMGGLALVVAGGLGFAASRLQRGLAPWEASAPTPSLTPTAAVVAATATPATPETPAAVPTRMARISPVAPATAKIRATPVAALEQGTLSVNARPWVQVWIDGKKVAAETPVRSLSLPAGTHALQLINPDVSFKAERTIHVPAAGQVRIFVDVDSGTVDVK